MTRLLLALAALPLVAVAAAVVGVAYGVERVGDVFGTLLARYWTEVVLGKGRVET